MASKASYHAALIELQQALQPPVPEFLDPEFGVRYVPADGATSGGDIYDWQLLRDGSLHVAVIDVVGKGLDAVRDALTITHAIRLLAISGTPIEALVESADRLLARTYPDLAATVVVARYDALTGVLLIANGGHPPPLLIEPDGTVAYLEASGRPIGWPGAGSDEAIATEMAPGSSVIFYTDGLVESNRNIEEGLLELQGLASALAGTAASEMAHSLVRQVLADASRQDDTLVVVLRRPFALPPA